MSIAVELSEAGKFFKDREVLRGISCRFEPGRISVVIGPNGSGKTTLLRAVAGLEALDKGGISYKDGNIGLSMGRALMRRMTLVSQRPCLFNTSLYKNIAYGLRLRGIRTGEARRRALEAAGAAGLSHLLHEGARTLSGGEAQRAALARAYALRPELVMLDEPAASLDPEGVALIEALIRRMNKEQGTTVLLVTHNMFQARRLADDVFFLYGGELVESGPSAGFFGGPGMELTRRFLAGEVVY